MAEVQKVLLCRLVWAAKYNSKSESFFAGRMSYPLQTKIAAELLNFAEEDGSFYGFVENRGHKINIEKLGAAKTSDSVTGVDVIFCSLHEESLTLRVVGWYENATVFRELQSPQKGSSRGGLPYYFKAEISSSRLLEEVDRNLLVPTKERIDQEGFIGQRNVFYPAFSKPYGRFLEAVKIASRNPGNRHNGKSEPIQENNDAYQEGQRLSQEIMISARSSKLVKDAKKYHGTTCQACGFNFGNFYGERGEGFIEVHHKLGIAQNGTRRSRVEDVDVLCANCHRMIHRKAEAIALQELKEMIADAKKQRR